MMRNKFSQEDINNILSMYYDGVTQQKIADQYCTAQGTIAGIIKRNDIDWKPRRGQTVDKSEYNNIVELYNNGKSQPEIAKIYNCSKSLISFILKQNGVKTRLGGSLNTNDDVEKWVRMYKDGMMIKDIAQEYGVSSITVSRALKNSGIEVDKYMYHFNEHFFDVIDTQEKAYILGVLWADGCNVLSKNYVMLSLQESDVDLLNQINVLTENERPLHKSCISRPDNNYHDQYIITWGSKYFCDTLQKLGMVPRKTLVAEYPVCLNEELHRHFCRGYLDGDGCISLQSDGRFASVSMVGTHTFLNRLQEIILKQTGVDVLVYRDKRARDPICGLRCSRKNDVKKLLDWIYRDANIFLQRKYDKYQKFINYTTNINNSYLS